VSRSDEQRIADILHAASELSEIVARGHETFTKDPILRHASERLLEIIGEAASMLSDDTTRQMPEVAWRDIRRLRIVLTHHYHRVDPAQVWVIASTDVPAMAERLSRFIR
jgi:uncharacterized protein with HEPN domain